MKLKLNLGSFYVLIAAALWGTAGIFVRNLSDDITRMQTVFGRALFTCAILAISILIVDKSLFKIKLRDIWIFVLDGVGSIIVFNYAYYTTMSLSSLSAAAVLLYTAPFFVVIISLFLFGKRLTLKKCVALIVAFLGCCLVTGIFGSSEALSSKALFFGLLTGFGYGLYTIFGDILIRKGYKTLTITFYVFLFAAVGCIPLADPVSLTTTVTPKTLLLVILMAIFNTVLPYIFYTNGLKITDPTSAPIIATLEPVVATAVGYFIFSEPLSFWGVIGIILVLCSVVILNLKENSLTAKAGAKINLSLHISGKREDGYHFIDTIMQSVTLSDTVRVKKAKDISVNCSVKEFSGEENIAFKAAQVFFEKTGISGGAHIYIRKRIPAAAGLGGGSADAAAVLLALDRIYETHLDYETLCEMGLKLGADVPFFIRGGTMRAQGIGEILTPLKDFKEGVFLLAKADKKPSTGEMYHQLDSHEYKKIDVPTAVEHCENNNLVALCKVMDNSFMSVWEGNALFERLKGFSPLGVGLSGSGPTFFCVFQNKSDAEKCRKALKNEGVEAFVVKPCSKSVFFH